MSNFVTSCYSYTHTITKRQLTVLKHDEVIDFCHGNLCSHYGLRCRSVWIVSLSFMDKLSRFCSF